MGGVLLAVLLRLLAPEPADPRPTALTNDVFLPTATAHSPEQELMPAQSTKVVEFLRGSRSPVQLDLPVRRIVGPEVFMPVGASTPTWRPSRRPPVWMLSPTVAGPEAFMSSRDSGAPRPEVFLPTQSGHKTGPAVFMLGTAPTVSASAVFMSTAR